MLIKKLDLIESLYFYSCVVSLNVIRDGKSSGRLDKSTKPTDKNKEALDGCRFMPHLSFSFSDSW